ncbi:MAG: hypothetical protein C4562_00710 [Actinobacteria bacterium]|nr:MAG: hypothetical protein C4562_00710 [Actinomycetota bacterium]
MTNQILEKIDQLSKKQEEQFNQLNKKQEEQFNQLSKKQDHEFALIKKRFEQQDKRFDEQDKRFINHDYLLDKLAEIILVHDQKLDKLDNDLHTFHTEMLTKHEQVMIILRTIDKKLHWSSA